VGYSILVECEAFDASEFLSVKSVGASNMNSQRLVSVIIPTFNRAYCVGQAIESALKQTWPYKEIIVVDDGSTDETSTVLAQYGSAIHVVRQANRGVAAAINAGLKCSQGDWIAVLGSDDIWLPDQLTRQQTDLAHYQSAVAHATDALVEMPGGALVSKFETMGVKAAYDRQPFRIRAIEDVLKVQFFSQACMYKASIIKQEGGLDESFRIYEDHELALRIALHGPWIVSTRAGVIVRRFLTKKDSLSLLHVTNPAESIEFLIKAYSRILRRHECSRADRKLLRRYLSAAYYDKALALLSENQRHSAQEHVTRSVLVWPCARSLARLLLWYAFGPKAWSGLKRLFGNKSFELRRSTAEVKASSKEVIQLK